MKQPKLTSLAVCAGLLIALGGCANLAPLLHRGDGEMSTGGSFGYGFRDLDLGEIDLTYVGTRAFQFGGPLADEMVVTLEVTEIEPNSFSKPQPMHSAIVRLVMRTTDDEVVIDETSSLSEWTWSFGEGSKISKYYIRGKSREIAIRENLTRTENLSVKAHGGWGSYFRPSIKSTYRLAVEILTPNREPITARVKLKGW
jgi:hypothetical protein